jgi:hypothetical protein
MADYKDRLGEWGEAARRKARELDERYKIKERVEEGARKAEDAARRGAARVAEETERARAEAERLGEDFEVRDRADELKEQARRVAGEAERAARAAGERVKGAAGAGAERAGEVFGGAKKTFDGARRTYARAARAVGAGARVSRLTAATTAGAYRAYDWARANPKQAVVVTLSVAAGVQAGAFFPRLDGVLLGAHPHWLTHSALPVWALRKAGSAFDKYLREREELIARGESDEAELRRAEFERKIVRYVGAPLLGAFSCAAGAAMWAQILQPGTIVGAPVEWLVGGNPFLSGVWLFANGVICFQQGYKFFMIALKDQREAERIVRELRGLLPAAATA